ncbi:alpha-tocopherol transfer protein-like isoform X2 [Bacillus rossius redtenbacheri]|uniref:alpha-tocopherol transfer protein-like isoform X2 n=1 Tax=Bacillus rossius redtenbacheri TaxID=93214 RepID=UPI002FDEF9C7
MVLDIQYLMSGGVAGLDLSPLGRQSAFIAQVELRETPARVQEAADALRRLLKARKDLYFRDDNDFLLRFLRPTKFYPESALELMVNVAKLKRKHGKVLCDLEPKEELHHLREHKALSVILERDKSGRKIFIMKVEESWDPAMVSAEQVFRVLYMAHVAGAMEPETQVKGIVHVLDLKGVQARQLWALTGLHTRGLLHFLQKAFPLRLKEIHIINHPPSFNTLLPLCKPFVSAKLYKRIFLHGDDLASLHRLVDPSRLPEDYGGGLAGVEHTGGHWHAVLLEVEEAIREWCTFGFVEDRRR